MFIHPFVKMDILCHGSVCMPVNILLLAISRITILDILMKFIVQYVLGQGDEYFRMLK